MRTLPLLVIGVLATTLIGGGQSFDPATPAGPVPAGPVPAPARPVPVGPAAFIADTTAAAAMPLSVSIGQQPAGYDAASNEESVSLEIAFVGAASPLHYDVAVRGTAVVSGDADSSPVTVSVQDACSIFTQSVTVAVSDETGATASAAATLDHSLCPPLPDVPHEQDRILSAPTLSRDSFVDRLRATGSPTLPWGERIYDLLVRRGVNPAFALGTFHAESGSGTLGYAVTTLNWGNILYRSWTADYGAVPYSPGNGYTYAMFPSWLAGVSAYAHLVRVYDRSGYRTVSSASARWLGTRVGSTRHVRYLDNITAVMSILPDDVAPRMTALRVPWRARGTFSIRWQARDNLVVAGYQVRVRKGSGSWSAPIDVTARSLPLTLGSGTWTVGVRAIDQAGNRSRWLRAMVRVDARSPVMGAVTAPRVVRAADGKLRASWSATDNRGVTGYEWRTRTGTDDPWSTVTKQSDMTLTRRQGVGAWTLAVRARDAVGNRSAWVEVPVVVPFDDRDYAFSAGAVRTTGSAYYLGTITRTRSPGSTMTIAFTGSAFHVLGTIAPNHGKLRVEIDGAGWTVDTGRWHGAPTTSTHDRVLLFSHALDAGDHVAVITNLATPSRPWIGIDGVGFGP
jgi:hypothetical protein